VTWTGIWAWLALAAIGAGSARFLAARAAASPARKRVNWRGAEVPVVLGVPLWAGGLVAAALVVAYQAAEVAAATALILVLLGSAGEWDDRRGDERARGFGGHFRAARSGRLTGGLVKLLAGGLAGLAAGFLTSSGAGVVQTALLVALSANLLNLLDRAPGRALKAAALLGIPLSLLGPPGWALAAAGTFGAAGGVAPLDLQERGMLGDSGANPLGGVLGLGCALSLSETWRVGAIAVLLALNLASERWSFSALIQRTPWLAVLDRLGRK
jgi:hypothetical protein